MLAKIWLKIKPFADSTAAAPGALGAKKLLHARPRRNRNALATSSTALLGAGTAARDPERAPGRETGKIARPTEEKRSG